MTPRTLIKVMLFLLFAGLVCCKTKVATEKRECFCSDGRVSVQECRVDGRGCNPCECTEYTVWCDPDTNLCWQDPQREAYNYDDIGLTPKATIQYCEELVLGGYDDWRVPTIKELRTLIAGNPDTEAGGACPSGNGYCRKCSPSAGPSTRRSGAAARRADRPGPGSCRARG